MQCITSLAFVCHEANVSLLSHKQRHNKMEIKTIENTAEEFLMWLQVEKRFAKSSIVSYRSRLKCLVRDIGDIEIERFTMTDIFRLKQILHERESRIPHG